MLVLLLWASAVQNLCAAAPIKNRLEVAVIIPDEYARLSMQLIEQIKQLRKRVRRLHGRPRLSIRLIEWENFAKENAYITFDAVIYISLYSQLPSDLSTMQSNELGRSFLDLLDAPIYSKFTPPKRLVWLLFQQTAQLDQYRLRYPKSPYISSNTGKAAIRRIFAEDLYPFLLRLQELYW